MKPPNLEGLERTFRLCLAIGAERGELGHRTPQVRRVD